MPKSQPSTLRTQVATSIASIASELYSEADILRLLKHLKKKSCGCIEFVGCYNSKGYGMLKVRGKAKYVHRMVMEINAGRELKPEEFVMHSCDNRKCCNPAHLTIGNLLENVADMVQKQRHCYGERNKRSRLKQHQVVAIKLALRMGQGCTAIAMRYGVSWHCIRDIRDGNTWRHVKVPPKPEYDPFLDEADCATENSVETMMAGV